MQILVLPGDGIGPEITAATLAVLRAASERFGLGLAFEQDVVGHESLRQYGTTVRPEVLTAARKVDGLILGPTATADFKDAEHGEINPSMFFRKNLDLFANIRPARTYPGVRSPVGAFDLVVVRENTEGFYADRNMEQGNGEILVTRDVAISLRRITRACCSRIARAAFELAARRRQHVSIVHKANVLKLGDGLFLEECRKVAAEFPGISLDDFIVDAMMAHVVRAPQRFDVIVTTNMFGDILSDLTAELSGKPRARRVTQRRRRLCDGAGRARIGSRYCGTRHCEPALADLVGGAAARLARPPGAGEGVRGGRGGNRARGRGGGGRG
jgi:3-isopropylmalate dehydrogenase